jgi:predicted MFS family arabinose efflux permease
MPRGVFRSIPRVYRAAFSGLPRDIWLLSLFALVNRAGSMVLPFFALFLTRERGLTLLEAGELVALYGVGSIAGSFLGGWLSDRIGSIRAQQASLVAAGVGYLVILYVESIPALGAVVLLSSVAAEAFRPAVMVSIAHRAPQEIRARSFALLRLAVNVGMAIGPAVGGFLATRSYTYLFVVDAATSWLAAILLARMLRGGRVGARQDEPKPPPSARSPWRDGPFLLLMVLVIAMGASLFQVFTTLPIHLRDAYHLRENGIGLVLAFNATIIVLFEMVLTHWTERRNRLLLIGLGSFLICAGLSLLPLGTSIALAAVSTLVWTVGEMLVLPLLSTVVAERAAGGRQGSYMGVYTVALSISFVIAPMAGTAIYEQLGPEALWFSLAGFGVLQLLGGVALIRPFRSGQPA